MTNRKHTWQTTELLYRGHYIRLRDGLWQVIVDDQVMFASPRDDACMSAIDEVCDDVAESRLPRLVDWETANESA